MSLGQVTTKLTSHFETAKDSFKNVFSSSLTYEQHRQIMGHGGAILTGMNVLNGGINLLNPLTWLKPENLLNFAALACLIPGMQWLMFPVAVFYGIKAVGHAIKALGSLNPMSEKGFNIGGFLENAIAAFFTAMSALPLGRLANLKPAYDALKVGQITKSEFALTSVQQLYGKQARQQVQSLASSVATKESRDKLVDKAAETYVKARNGFRDRIKAAEEHLQPQLATALAGA